MSRRKKRRARTFWLNDDRHPACRARRAAGFQERFQRQTSRRLESHRTASRWMRSPLSKARIAAARAHFGENRTAVLRDRPELPVARRARGNSARCARPTCIRRTTPTTPSSSSNVSTPRAKSLERFTVADVFGKHDWQPVKQARRVAEGRRLRALPRRSSTRPYGQFWVDDLSAAYLAPAAEERRPHRARALLHRAAWQSALPQRSAHTSSVTVEARKPLPRQPAHVSYVVRDYWGAEQIEAARR